jgi:glycosyltransferase involved in cell wall biosynthesis
MKPLVSILMSSYNDEAYVKSAIESVLNQSYGNFEFLITDDSSTDTTAKILSEYAAHDSRITLIKNKENKKLTANLNRMWDMAKGSYMARIDSDDVWTDRTKLEFQIDFLTNNPDHILVGSWAVATDAAGREMYKISYPQTNNEIRNVILRHNCFIHSSVVFFNDALKDDRYDIENNYSQDYELWLKLGSRGKIANIPRYMVNYRINPTGTSQKDYRVQTDHSYRLISRYKTVYPNYYSSKWLWFIRRYYPSWLRFTMPKVKNLLSS